MNTAVAQILEYCLQVQLFYDGKKFLACQKSLLQAALQSLDAFRVELEQAVGSWLRSEDILPLLFMLPNNLKFTPSVLPRVAAATTFLLHHGLCIPVVFRQEPLKFKPILGDESASAETCLYFLYILTATFREQCYRDGFTTPIYFTLSHDLTDTYREPICIDGFDDVGYRLESKQDADNLFEYFESLVYKFLQENLFVP